jgi:hypothetical protein
MNDDENLKKALKYNPELATACQNWIEGIPSLSFSCLTPPHTHIHMKQY